MKTTKKVKRLVRKPELVCITILTGCLVNSIVISSDWSLLNRFIFIIFAYAISEVFLRIILFIMYGKNYIYRIKPYYIVRDRNCGYKLRPRVDSKDISFPIFERYAFPSEVTPSINLKINKNQRVRFTTDNMGLRTVKGKTKSQGAKEIKILCSGGSTTAGQGIHDEECWPMKLEENLRGLGIKNQVINAGVYGFDSYQELNNIKNNLIGLNADILILHQGWNEEFAFSVAKNKKQFKPKQSKGYLEKLFFYTNNIKFFPRFSIVSIIIYRLFRVQYLFKNKKGRMNFKNIKRWENLIEDNYMKSWFDNLIEIKNLCIKNNIKLFLLNYPCLVNSYDKIEDRNIYVENSRLTEEHAAYQAFSKSRISEMHRLIDAHFDILDGENNFRGISGFARLKYFNDEIHLSAIGEELLAKNICRSIKKYYGLNSESNNSIPNIIESKSSLDSIKRVRCKVGRNSNQLGIKIRKYINIIRKEYKDSGEIIIPTDIYTTT